MKRRKLAWLIPLAGLIVLAGPNGVRSADEIGEAPQVAPYRAEAAVAGAPVAVLVQDVDELIERLGTIPQNVTPGQAEESPEEIDRERGSRVINIDPPQVVNRSPYFQFRDLTDRGQVTPGQAGPKLSDATRRKVMERYRQSLAKKKEVGRN